MRGPRPRFSFELIGLPTQPGRCGAGRVGISELRIKLWARIPLQRGTKYIVLLAGGDKSKQDRDIAEANRLAAEYEE